MKLPTHSEIKRIRDLAIKAEIERLMELRKQKLQKNWLAQLQQVFPPVQVVTSFS